MKKTAARLIVSGTISKNGFITMAMIAAILIFAGCDKNQEAPPAEVIRPVKVMTVAGTGPDTIMTYPGRTRANRRADLSFKVPGPLVELPVEEGQYVKKGALIARILPRDFKIALDQATARAVNAQRQYDRYKELYVRRQVSKADFDRFKAERDVAAAALQDAKNALKDTYLRAPFDGIVARRYVENFQEVQAKQPIVFFQDNSKIEVLVDAPETVIANLRKDNEKIEAYAAFAAAPDRRFPLALKEYSTEADPQTQTYQVVLIMDPPGELNILPGMTARVTGKHVQGPARPRIVIPAAAVTADAKGGSFVWLLDKKTMTVKKHLVVPGELAGAAGLRIREGLNSGETIVTSGLTKLRDGMKVSIWKQ